MPTAQLDSTQHQFMNHTFNYPNRVVWQPISVTLVDMVQPDMGASILGVLRQSGYTWPEDLNQASTNITKAQATSPFDKVTISQTGRPVPLSGLPGTNVQAELQDDIIDQWELHNAFINGTIDFGGELSYGSDDLVEVKFDLQYDYAYLNRAGGQNEGWLPPSADGLSPTFASRLDDPEN